MEEKKVVRARFKVCFISFENYIILVPHKYLSEPEKKNQQPKNKAKSKSMVYSRAGKQRMGRKIKWKWISMFAPLNRRRILELEIKTVCSICGVEFIALKTKAAATTTAVIYQHDAQPHCCVRNNIRSTVCLAEKE